MYMIVKPNLNMPDDEALFISDLIHQVNEILFYFPVQHFVSVFGSPYNMVVQIVDARSTIYKSAIMAFHAYIIACFRIPYAGVQSQFITGLKNRVSLYNPQKSNSAAVQSMMHGCVCDARITWLMKGAGLSARNIQVCQNGWPAV